MTTGAETEEHLPGEGDHGAEIDQEVLGEHLTMNLAHHPDHGPQPHLMNMMIEQAENTPHLPRWRMSSETN